MHHLSEEAEGITPVPCVSLPLMQPGSSPAIVSSSAVMSHLPALTSLALRSLKTFLTNLRSQESRSQILSIPTLHSAPGQRSPPTSYNPKPSVSLCHCHSSLTCLTCLYSRNLFLGRRDSP